MSTIHWTHGGIGVTNFPVDEQPLFQAAIDEYGDPSIFISNDPMNPHLPDRLCLCDRQFHSRKDLGEFWDVWRKLKSKADAREDEDED